ncbi:LysR family transcriptional regulator [Methylocapsa sp. S129]|uniref:LysR substrate-binding domain-containing protein n=1 Tax=Methylocapsa sp. S129 TaxID=1641869 RepID=UPI00131DCB56|nr:LysR family transcriptional regulator [Methylocapsa sp. S129]
MTNERRSADTLLRGRSSAFTLQHLRYAISAEDHGSFRQAAEALLLRQSKLSRCIRQLEESIGMVVFERSSGGVRATNAGQKFLRAARSILEQMDALVAIANRTGRGEAGQLAIGFYTSLSNGNLRATLMDYARRFPQIEISMFESSRLRLATAVRNGGLDIAIVTGESPLLDCKAAPLWSERILVAVPEGHRLAASETVYWTDLRGETLLLNQDDPGEEFQDLLVTKLASSEDRPRVLRHDVSRGSLKNLVGAGFGVSLVTEAGIGLTFPGLIYREVRDGAGASRVGYSAHWRGDNENPALASFLTLLGERYPLPVVGG